MQAILKRRWLPKLPDNANLLAHLAGMIGGVALVHLSSGGYYQNPSFAFSAMGIAIFMSWLQRSFLTMPLSPTPSFLLYITARAAGILVVAFLLWQQVFERLALSSN
jgi:hypothetical protein